MQANASYGGMRLFTFESAHHPAQEEENRGRRRRRRKRRRRRRRAKELQRSLKI